MQVTYADDLETKLIGVERTALEKARTEAKRRQLETQVQDPIDERNPIGDYLKHIVTNGKEPEDMRFWGILAILGVLFLLAIMGTR